MKKNKTYVISLGGSLIAPPEGIDWKFLKKFRAFIVSEIKKNKRFVIITGGGSTCRKYLQAASQAAKLTPEDGDWLGIHATRLNAHLIKTIFRAYAHSRINKNPFTKEDLRKHFKNNEKIMVAAGWRPGWSTDYVAVILAERLGVKTIVNLSNTDYVYDRDPKKFKNVKKIKAIGWAAFQKIVGDKWDPGLNAPFDPVATRRASKNRMTVAIINGRKLSNLKNFLAGKKFTGTIIAD